MGLMAKYFEVDENLLKRLKGKSEEDIAEIVEELEDDEERNNCDLDKMWDGVHYILTKTTMEQLDKSDLLSLFVVGDKVINEEEFTATVTPEKVKEIVNKLRDLDIKQYLGKFEPRDFDKAEIYPNIWLNEDKEDLKESLLENFELLRQFYYNVAENNNGIIVSII